MREKFQVVKGATLRVLSVAATSLLLLWVIGSGNALAALCPPQAEVSGIRLVIAPRTAAAGKTIHYRIDNSDGPTLTFGAPFSIQQCVAGRWVLAAFSPTVFTKQRIQQRPGPGGWYSVYVSATATPGNYRIRKSVYDYDGERWYWLYSEFSVPRTAP